MLANFLKQTINIKTAKIIKRDKQKTSSKSHSASLIMKTLKPARLAE
jgi:hypothetical protein